MIAYPVYNCYSDNAALLFSKLITGSKRQTLFDKDPILGKKSFRYHCYPSSDARYTWTILLINQLGEIGETQLSVFGSRGGQICPLMHVPLWCKVTRIHVHSTTKPLRSSSKVCSTSKSNIYICYMTGGILFPDWLNFTL